MGKNSQRVTQLVNLPTFRLTTSEGPVQFQNVELYLLEPADEMLLGLPFTKAIGFDIGIFLAENSTTLNGLDLNTQADLQGAEIRRLLTKSAGDYVPIQLDARAPLDDADPLEYDAPCLTIGQVDSNEEISLC